MAMAALPHPVSVRLSRRSWRMQVQREGADCGERATLRGAGCDAGRERANGGVASGVAGRHRDGAAVRQGAPRTLAAAVPRSARLLRCRRTHRLVSVVVFLARADEPSFDPVASDDGA